MTLEQIKLKLLCTVKYVYEMDKDQPYEEEPMDSLVCVLACANINTTLHVQMYT